LSTSTTPGRLRTASIGWRGGEDLFLLREHFVAYLTPVVPLVAGKPVGDLYTEVERINYDESINDRLVIDAGEGDDRFYADDNSALTTLIGGEGSDRFQFGQVFSDNPNGYTYPDASVDPRLVADDVDGIDLTSDSDDIALVETTRGWLSNGVSYDATVEGGQGDDVFVVFHNTAPLELLGGTGDDVFTVRAFALANSTDTGTFGEKRTDILGGQGDDRIEVIGTEFADRIVVSDVDVTGMGLTVAYAEVEKLEIDAGEGDDELYVTATHAAVETYVYGDLGSDQVAVVGDVPEVVTAEGLQPAEAGSHTTEVIAGPLFVDGLGGTGTAGGLDTPVLLPDESGSA